MDMKDNQDRIDAYLRNEMKGEERIAFEKELKTDGKLAADYAMTKNIAKALSDRQEKAKKMKQWDQEIKNDDEQQKRKIWMWSIAISAAACAAILLLVFIPMNKIDSSKINGVEGYSTLRGNMEYEDIDKLIDHHQYDKALLMIDSLQNAYQSSNKEYFAGKRDSINEEQAYNIQLTKLALYELTWRKIHVLIALDRKQEALKLLESFRSEEGDYQQKADSLWNKLKR